MTYKYTVAALTLGCLGYNAYDETEEVFKAVTETGYDGIDLFDFAEKRDLGKIKHAAASTGLKIPEVMGNWGFNKTGRTYRCVRRDVSLTFRSYKNSIFYNKLSLLQLEVLG